MTRKSYTCYEAVFKFIENNVFKLEPNEIITDFEGGLRKAINFWYPNTTLRGCWYHYCCAVTRKIAKLGLNSLIISNPDANLISKQLLNLPLLSKNKFKEGFRHIKQTAVKSDIENHFNEFFNYFEEYWFEQVSRV